MNKSVTIKGVKSTVKFNYTVNSKVFINSIDKSKTGDLISIVGYDYIINDVLYKIVATTFAGKPNRNSFFGGLNTVTTLTVPELLPDTFQNNHKAVIEAILNNE